MKPHDPQDLLTELLVGVRFFYLSVGDWWSLSLNNGMWLIFQGCECSFDDELKARLSGEDPIVLDGVEPEEIPIAIAVFRNRQKLITGANLSPDGTLTLSFDQGWYLRLTTTTDIADWQWALTRNGEDPYTDSIVACFWRGSVEIGD